MKPIKYILILCLSGGLIACHKDAFEPYDHPFIHIMQNGESSVTVSAAGTFIASYNVYLSSESLMENLLVDFEIRVGDGLKEGMDYELLTTGNQLVFPPGIFEMPIRIRWMRNPVDETKNNTLQIVLVSNSLNFTLGLPGPDGKQKVFVINKVN